MKAREIFARESHWHEAIAVVGDVRVVSAVRAGDHQARRDDDIGEDLANRRAQIGEALRVAIRNSRGLARPAAQRNDFDFRVVHDSAHVLNDPVCRVSRADSEIDRRRGLARQGNTFSLIPADSRGRSRRGRE